MNVKNKLALLGLAMLALVAMTPAASADPGFLHSEASVGFGEVLNPNTQICVYDPTAQGLWGILWPTNGCGEAKDSWVTIKDLGGFQCVTSHGSHPRDGC